MVNMLQNSFKSFDGGYGRALTTLIMEKRLRTIIMVITIYNITYIMMTTTTLMMMVNELSCNNNTLRLAFSC